MISVAEALALIRAARRNFDTEDVHLLKATGRVLAQDVMADRDFPPYDRVTMDGIAIAAGNFHFGMRSFFIEQLQPAGHPQQTLKQEGTCIEVMTGAVLPAGCDAVVPYEDCTIKGNIAQIEVKSVQAGQNIHPRGTDAKRGQLLLAKNAVLTPAMIGIAATTGLEKIKVRCLPRVAVCSTGDELVPIDTTPEPHQIRRSNSYMLAAALSEEGISATLFHLPDHQEKMTEQLAAILPEYDVILFSGAVSKGKYDYLPGVLSSLDMRTIFHRVAQKPGKPLLFGAFDNGPVVFGFPGNPVSALVCYHVFFKAWLLASLSGVAPQLQARLAVDFTFTPALDYHLPVEINSMKGTIYAMPCVGANSGDMVSLASAAAVITLPAARHDFKNGEAFPLTWLK